MDNNYPKNADPRPKRRKDKDNPYTIYLIESETDHPKYFARFTDGEGIDQYQEMSKELFDQMNEFELDDPLHLNKVDWYMAWRVLQVPSTPIPQNIHYKIGNEKAYRTALYRWLVKKLKIPVEECHFGYFDLDMLERAYEILDDVKDKEMSLNSRGKVRFN